MPYIIPNDNEHGYANIHSEIKKIKTPELKETLNIIIRHIKKYNRVKIKELREELIIWLSN